MKKIVLLSILPEWAEAILEGKKKWEYRRIPPKVETGTRIVMYATGNRKEILGDFFVEKILKQPINELIEQTLSETPHQVEDIHSYFTGLKIGSAIKIKDPKRYKKNISLNQIKDDIPDFVPPQSFRYLTDARFKPLMDKLPKRVSTIGQRELFEFVH